MQEVIVKQLAKPNYIVFKSEEIQAACPGILTIPEAINGFGLLQTVQQGKQ